MLQSTGSLGGTGGLQGRLVHVSSGKALTCFRGFTLETEPGRGQLHSVFQGALALVCHLPVCRLAYGMTVNDDHCIRMLIQRRVQAVFIHSLT